MAIIRAILAALISLSVAVIPATAGAGTTTKPVEMSMAGPMDDMPCCPDSKIQDDFKSSIACTGKCINAFAAILPSALMAPQRIEGAILSFADEPLHGHERSPPTHPPTA